MSQWIHQINDLLRKFTFLFTNYLKYISSYQDYLSFITEYNIIFKNLLHYKSEMCEKFYHFVGTTIVFSSDSGLYELSIAHPFATRLRIFKIAPEQKLNEI